MNRFLLILIGTIFLFSGCAGMDTHKDFMDMAEDTGGSAKYYI